MSSLQQEGEVGRSCESSAWGGRGVGEYGIKSADWVCCAERSGEA